MVERQHRRGSESTGMRKRSLQAHLKILGRHAGVDGVLAPGGKGDADCSEDQLLSLRGEGKIERQRR